MKGVKKLFVDTNIIIFATNELSPWHVPATTSLLEAWQNEVELIISQQILREYLAAATRFRAFDNELRLSEVLENVRILRTDYTVVADNAFVLDCLIELMQKVTVGGKQVHDANIVATMRAHNITHLLTHNTADFLRFVDFITVVPLEPEFLAISLIRLSGCPAKSGLGLMVFTSNARSFLRGLLESFPEPKEI